MCIYYTRRQNWYKMQKINYTYRFRLNPNECQKIKLAKHFGTCRFVYNYFLDRRNKLYKENQKGSTYNQDSAELTKLKNSLDWIYDCNSQTLQAELKFLDSAFNRFFKKQACFPRFKSKVKDNQSFRVPQHVSVENNKLFFPKFKEGISVNLHRPIEGEIKNITVVCNKAGQYYVSICVEKYIMNLKPIDSEVGIDFGISTLATLSNGQLYENISPYRTLERRIKLLSGNHSRKQKGSKNKEKSRRRLAKLHQRVSDIRRNHLHQMTRQIINENQVIAVEDLNVSGMMRNRRLAKSIQDVSFYELGRQLEYKSAWYGRQLIKVGRFYPSTKTCSGCAFINQTLTLADREWQCPRCNVNHNRDLNAAINILNEAKRTVGTTGLACGENVRLSQESNFH